MFIAAFYSKTKYIFYRVIIYISKFYGIFQCNKTKACF